MDTLPQELLIELFLHLNISDFVNFRATCKRIYAVKDTQYWHSLSKRWHHKVVRGIDVKVVDNRTLIVFYRAVKRCLVRKVLL